MVENVSALEGLIHEMGLLPFFTCAIAGFSLKAHTPPDRWFVKDVEGPWEWREAIAEKGEIAYARLFRKKMGFVSPALYPDLVNVRRNGMDFDVQYEAGYASRNEKILVDLLAANGSLLSHDLKRLSGIEKGFETAITSLQMRTYVTIQRMDYHLDRYGRPYGWGTSRFALAETIFGEDFVCSRYDDPIEVSLGRLYHHIAQRFPDAAEKEILSLLR